MKRQSQIWKIYIKSFMKKKNLHDLIFQGTKSFENLDVRNRFQFNIFDCDSLNFE
jgi:hypothetical protein